MARKKPLSSGMRQAAIEYCKRVRKPILIGRLATDLGWWADLRAVETLLEEFVAEGLCRRLTEDECRQFDISFGYASV